MSGKFHTVKQGECLYSISRSYGYRKWESIYNHEKNEPLRQSRPDPNCLNPGDRVYIPEKNQSSIQPTGNTLKIIVPNQQSMFKLRVLDRNGNSWAGVYWQLCVGDDVYNGTADGEGFITQRIEVATESAVLKVYENSGDKDPVCIWYVNIGHLEPVDEQTGVQERLKNMGCYTGEINGRMDEKTRDGVKRFQEEVSMEPTGEVSEETRQKLKSPKA